MFSSRFSKPNRFCSFWDFDSRRTLETYSYMPNTGRFYAPMAAAAYRDRYMRPYSTVSAPVGGHAVAVPSPKLPTTASCHGRTAAFRRADEDTYASPSSPPLYENRVRGRTGNVMFERQEEDDRRYITQSAFQEKQSTRSRAWPEDITPSLSTNTDMLPLDTMRRGLGSTTRYIGSIEDVKSAVYEPVGAVPSTLPRLSSLLNRSGSACQFIDEQRLTISKRPRDLSPDESMLPAKFSRRFYDEDAVDERATYVENPKTEFSSVSRHEAPMAIKKPAGLVRSHLLARLSAASPPSSSRDYEDSPRYSYKREATDEHDRAPSHIVQPQVRRARDVYASETSFRSAYEDQISSFESQRRSYYIPDAQRPHAGDMFRRVVSSDLDSPRPTPASRDAFSPVVRYSDSKEGERVIEAAADLVEERSPSKRESITKLLLKSKEFLKAKSLVRNRNNEIDWVATFLNVGFESNSIYSLMCPLRKGRWKVEEEKYTMELLRLIENGTIRLRHGQSIRGFIAKKLHSDDMRVLKKLSNCKMFHFARLINPRMSEEEEIDESLPNARSSLDRLDKLKAEFLRSVQLEALVAVRKYLSDTSIRDLLNARD